MIRCDVRIFKLIFFGIISDACENVKCGANSECLAARHNSQCKCKSGYVRSTSGGCVLQEKTCSSKKDCSNDQYCYKNLCKGKKIYSNEV